MHHYFGTFNIAAYIVYFYTNTLRNITVCLHYLVYIHKFPLTESKFSSLGTVYKFGLTQIKE